MGSVTVEHTVHSSCVWLPTNGSNSTRLPFVFDSIVYTNLRFGRRRSLPNVTKSQSTQQPCWSALIINNTAAATTVAAAAAAEKTKTINMKSDQNDHAEREAKNKKPEHDETTVNVELVISSDLSSDLIAPRRGTNE